MSARILWALPVGLLVACASTPPQELSTARSAYEAASRGPAVQYAPADLHAARESLAAAEQAFASDGDTDSTRDAAYAAQRRSQLADARGKTLMANQERDQANTQAQAIRDQKAALTSAELAKTEQQLARERQRREEAEKRATQASQDLARIASVKQESRGMVITLSGSVLFASSKSDLLPAAQAKLSQVADVLAQQDKDSKILVQGYTDSQGPQSFNQNLSQSRAEAVRSYLVSHGIASDRVTAQGMGPSNPIADNATAEGRADNRRVEIIVQPMSAAASD